MGKEIFNWWKIHRIHIVKNSKLWCEWNCPVIHSWIKNYKVLDFRDFSAGTWICELSQNSRGISASLLYLGTSDWKPVQRNSRYQVDKDVERFYKSFLRKIASPLRQRETKMPRSGDSNLQHNLVPKKSRKKSRLKKVYFSFYFKLW